MEQRNGTGIYHPSVYTDPWIEAGIANSLLTLDGSHTSKWVAASQFRITRSFELDGEGTTAHTPLISMPNWTQRKHTELLLFCKIWQDCTDFLTLLHERFGWLTKNMAPVDPSSAGRIYIFLFQKHWQKIRGIMQEYLSQNQRSKLYQWWGYLWILQAILREVQILLPWLNIREEYEFVKWNPTELQKKHEAQK